MSGAAMSLVDLFAWIVLVVLLATIVAVFVAMGVHAGPHRAPAAFCSWYGFAVSGIPGGDFEGKA
jgi:hypothetical protein